mgnify:CR=1 FL=1
MQSFKTLYREHYGFVWSTVRRHGVAPMLVEDAVHDTFVVAYRRLDAFDGRRPRAWLYSIGRRVASSYRRTQTRRDARHRSVASPPNARDALEHAVGTKTTLERFLDSLSPADRELFVLSEVDGLTGPELAATLGRKLPTVYSRIRVLRQRFEHSTGDTPNEERPHASARGWALLQPWLAAPSVSGTALFAVAAAVAVAGVVTVAVVRSAEPPVSTPIPTAPKRAEVAPSPSPPKPAPRVPAAARTPGEPPVVEAPRAEPTRPTPRTRPRRDEQAASTPVYDLAADTRLLRQANQAVQRGDATQARTLLEQHEAEFREPSQPDLRTTVWVATLCALGREDEAKRRAQALLKARPGTPFAPRLRSSCAAEP